MPLSGNDFRNSLTSQDITSASPVIPPFAPLVTTLRIVTAVRRFKGLDHWEG